MFIRKAELQRGESARACELISAGLIPKGPQQLELDPGWASLNPTWMQGPQCLDHFPLLSDAH